MVDCRDGFAGEGWRRKSLLVKEAVRATVNDQLGWWGYVGRVIWV